MNENVLKYVKQVPSLPLPLFTIYIDIHRSKNIG